MFPSFTGDVTTLSLLLFAATCFLAYSNGANDNFKGVASLFGSDTTDYRSAIAWGTAATLLGSVASIFLAQGLLSAFSGKGLVPDLVAGREAFLLAVAVGAGGTVFLATILGFPISTTHGLVGAMVGAGFVAAGNQLNLNVLASTFVLPLVASPFMALLLAGALYTVFHKGRTRLGIEKDTCLCIGEAAPALTPLVGSLAALAPSGVSVQMAVDSEEWCEERYARHFFGIQWQRLLDSAHYLSALAVSFARGLNDTPKIAALLLVLQVVHIQWGIVVIGMAMAAGGLISARKVAVTMGRRITDMNHGQGFAANVATSVLVIIASRFGLPVSTTHVSVGSLFGIGLITHQADLRVIRNVALAWVITLPGAALLAALTYWVIAPAA